MENREQNQSGDAKSSNENPKSLRSDLQNQGKTEKPREIPGPDPGILNSLAVRKYIRDKFTPQN